MKSLRGQASSSEAVSRNKSPRGVVSVPRISWGEGGREGRDGGKRGRDRGRRWREGREG